LELGNGGSSGSENQQRALYSLLSADYLCNIMVITAHHTVPVCSLPFNELLCDTFSLENTDDVVTTSKISIATLQYKKGILSVLMRMMKQGLPQFGKIHSFVSLLTATAGIWW